MKYNIQQSESYSLASITESKSDLVSAKITIDIHNEKMIKDEALQTIYAAALLSGSGKMSREQFLDAVNKLGASIEVLITAGKLNINLKGLKSNFSTLLKLTEQMLTEPTFTQNELARIKLTTANELNEAKENSKQRSQSELLNVFYGHNDRKYSYAIDEVIPELKKVTNLDLKKLHQRALAQTWICSIAGEEIVIKKFELTVENIKKQIKNLTDSLAIHQPKPPSHKAVFVDIPSRSNIDINIGIPVPITLHHPDYTPLQFGLNVLANPSFAGRLMTIVRDKEGLTYMIYGRLEGFTGDEQGYWRIETFFSPDKVEAGLKSTIREITKIFKSGITAAEFEHFKTTFKTKQTLLNDSVYKLLADLHSFHCQGFSLNEMKEFKEKIDSLTIAEVNQAIKTYLNPNEITISCAGPVSKVKKDIEKVIK